MRRRAKTEAGLETYAVLRSLEALDRADLALLVVDATVGATAQDQRLAERIAAAGCPSVVVLNKWDLIATDDRTDVLASVADRLAFLGDAPVLKVAATSGTRRAPGPARRSAPRRPTTTGASRPAPLNRALRDLQAHHAAPGARIRYAVQGAIDPPTFTLFLAGRLPQPYLRYVEAWPSRAVRARLDAPAAAGADRLSALVRHLRSARRRRRRCERVLRADRVEPSAGR